MVTHGEFVNQIREVVDSLGLITLRMKSHLAMGFMPDLLVMCGVGEEDRVFIDAINTRVSLNRDVGALLKLKANYDKNGVPYRRIYAVCSNSIGDKDRLQFSALEQSNPKFQMMRFNELKGWMKVVLKEALREKLEQLNQEMLEWYFSSGDVCFRCGEWRNIRGIEGLEWECMNCGFRWKQMKHET